MEYCVLLKACLGEAADARLFDGRSESQVLGCSPHRLQVPRLF
jgi:hypothetical protein